MRVISNEEYKEQRLSAERKNDNYKLLWDIESMPEYNTTEPLYVIHVPKPIKAIMKYEEPLLSRELVFDHRQVLPRKAHNQVSNEKAPFKHHSMKSI